METKSFFSRIFGGSKVQEAPIVHEASKVKEDPWAVKIGEPISINDYFNKEMLDENSVIYYQTQLAFPNQKIYLRQRREKSSKDTIFEFTDVNDVIFGKYEYMKLDVSGIDYDKLVEIYPKEFLDNVTHKIVRKTYIDDREAIIVSGKIFEKNFDFFAAVIIEGSNLTIFKITANENFLFLNPSFAYSIFASYKFIKNQGLNQRMLKNFICFRNMDGNMEYYDDFDGERGYFVTGDDKNLKLSLLFGVKEVFASTIDGVRKDQTDEEVDYFEDVLVIGPNEFTCKGYSYKNWLNYLVTYKNVHFRFSINVESTEGKIHLTRNDLQKKNLWPAISALTRDNFFFNF